MELLIGLGIVLAMSEWREHRARLSVKRLTLEINRQKRVIDKLLERQAKFLKVVQDTHEATLQSYKAAMEARASSIDTQDQLKSVHANVETILKEYELNGIPLGYQRKSFDIVEGL